MFNKLKQRWQVNGTNLVLILFTFSLGGSLCGFAGRKLLAFTNLEKGFFWVLIYVLLITLLWPFCVLLISIPFGQFPFFKRYLTKIWNRINGRRKKPVPVAIFASGTGSNAAKIIEYSLQSNQQNAIGFRISLIMCNKHGAGVLDVANRYQIDSIIIDGDRFFNGDGYIPLLKEKGIGFIVLAGFLWKVPPPLIRAYPNKILNIHPALLPKYGGKGMYGDKVHEAVIAAGENESGITIHCVDEIYDHGAIVFQAHCTIEKTDTPQLLAKKIHLLEHQHYPRVVGEWIEGAK